MISKEQKKKYKIAMKNYDKMFEKPADEIIRLKHENKILQDKIIELKKLLSNT